MASVRPSRRGPPWGGVRASSLSWPQDKVSQPRPPPGRLSPATIHSTPICVTILHSISLYSTLFLSISLYFTLLHTTSLYFALIYSTPLCSNILFQSTIFSFLENHSKEDFVQNMEGNYKMNRKLACYGHHLNLFTGLLVVNTAKSDVSSYCQNCSVCFLVFCCCCNDPI